MLHAFRSCLSVLFVTLLFHRSLLNHQLELVPRRRRRLHLLVYIKRSRFFLVYQVARLFQTATFLSPFCLFLSPSLSQP